MEEITKKVDSLDDLKEYIFELYSKHSGLIGWAAISRSTNIILEFDNKKISIIAQNQNDIFAWANHLKDNYPYKGAFFDVSKIHAEHIEKERDRRESDYEQKRDNKHFSYIRTGWWVIIFCTLLGILLGTPLGYWLHILVNT